MEAKVEHKEYFSPEELADWLGLGRTTTYQLLSKNAIPSFKIGRRRIVRRCDVETWLEQYRSENK